MNAKGYYQKYGRLYYSIIRLGMPLLLGQLGVIVTSYADTIMVGNYSTEALASSAFTNSALNLVIMFLFGFSYGITPIVGALFTKGDNYQLGISVRASVIANFLYTLAWCIPMLLLYASLGHLGMPDKLLPLIRPYYMLIFLSIIPLGIINALRQFTDAINDTKVSMFILVAGNLLNIVLNYMLIYGHYGMPELGLTGAGIATLIARIFMLVVYVTYVLTHRRYAIYRKGLLHGHATGSHLREITGTSLPISLQMGMETAIFTVGGVLSGWLGAEEMAAVQVVNTIGQIGFMVYYSIGAAASIKMANYCGVRNYGRVRHTAHASYVLTLVCLVIACSTFIIFGRPLAEVFTNDPLVVTLVITHMLHLTVYQFGDATQIAYSNALRGIGHVKPIMNYAFISYIVIGIPALYVCTFTLGMGMAGIYLAYFVALLIAGIGFCRSFYKRMHELLMKSASR